LVPPPRGYALTVDRTALLAEEAGLRHVDRHEPGLARRRCGRGFVYLDEHGTKVSRERAEWITSLAIPPAWSDVWISPDPAGHLLATGVDDAGRVQYLYHPDYRSAADELKFARLVLLGARLPRLRRHLATCIRSRDERTRTTAHLAHLIDVTLMRVGSPDAARSANTYGASTLRARHVSLHDGVATFEFPGKGGIEQRIDCDDRVIVRYVKQARRRRGAPLFATSDGWSPTRRDVAAMLSAASGLDVTAKDLRTWGATAHMVRVLCDGSADGILDAYDAVAQRLGNTRSVCRASYVAPAVVEAWTSDALAQVWAASRTTKWLRREERAARAVLGLRQGDEGHDRD
jgi:DNA topoisomerase-1